MKKFFALLSVAAIALSAAQAQAITMTLTPTVTAAFDTSFNPIALPDISTNPGFAAVYQVDFMLSVSDVVAPQAGFANVGFNILSNGVTPDSSGWSPNTSTVDSNGGAPGGVVPLFATNVDGGTPGDLQGILTSIAGGVTAAVDPRRTVGQGTPALLGSVFVNWNGTSAASLSTGGVLFSYNNTSGQFVDSGSGASATINFGGAGPAIPEPASLAMASMGLMGLALRRRNG